MHFVLLVLASSPSFARYDTYEGTDEEDNQEEGKLSVDYSRYFGTLGGSVGPESPAPPADDTSGFVQPLDFTGFFAAGHFGLEGLAGGASQQIFQTPGGSSVVLPHSAVGFPLHSDPALSNTSGFVNHNINFHSLFDTSSSASQNGFRPQDFLTTGTQPETTSLTSLFSPDFASLQHDVDRQVNYQRQKENDIELSRAANRRQQAEEGEEEVRIDFDPLQYQINDHPISDIRGRSPEKSLKQPYEDDEEEQYETTSRKQVSYKTPFSRVNQLHQRPTFETHPLQTENKKPLPTVPDRAHVGSPSSSYSRRGYKMGALFPMSRSPVSKRIQPKYSSNNIPQNQIYKSSHHTHLSPATYPPQYSHPNKPYSSLYNSERSQPFPHTVEYEYAPTKHAPLSAQSKKICPKNVETDFRPSPRDPYLDLIHKPSDDRSLSSQKHSPSKRDEIDSLPQTAFARVIHRISKQPVESASVNKKLCQKVKMLMNPDYFASYKQQQMTCYICTNKETDNTYEECIYESEPKGIPFHKGSAEALRSQTILTPTVVHPRERRSIKHPLENLRKLKASHDSPLVRNIRQYQYAYEPGERGHGPEHFRFGPGYFRQQGFNKNSKPIHRRTIRRNHEEEDYDSEEIEEESDIEKEYAAPGASEGDNCERVIKNSLICMVCTNTKSGGSYEQCSYTSEPDEDRYEYARQSTYGSKRRPENERYKRYSKVERRKDSKKIKHPTTKRIYHHSTSGKDRKKGSNFTSGKLKRNRITKADNYKKPIAFNDGKGERNTVLKEIKTPRLIGLDPFFYGSPGLPYNTDDYDERGKRINRANKEESEGDEPAAYLTAEAPEDDSQTYEESFFRLFPELKGIDPYTGESLTLNKEEKPVNVPTDNFDHLEIPYEDVEDEEESESKQEHEKIKPDFKLTDYYYFNKHKPEKDFEKALNEFIQKNRSECTKVMKDKMTCFQCIDDKGTQHEECMFVAGSQPKSKHLAYHEVKEFQVIPIEKRKIPNTKGEYSEHENKHNQTEIPQSLRYVPHPMLFPEKLATKANSKQDYHGTIMGNSQKLKSSKLRKTTVNLDKEKSSPTKFPMLAVINSEGQHALAHDILKINPKDIVTQSEHPSEVASAANTLRRHKRKPKDIAGTAKGRLGRQTKEEESESEKDGKGKDVEGQKEQPPKLRRNYNSIPPEPEGFKDREGPEGAYSHETEPVFDSILKMSLPKYMLTKSEHEEIFDEVLRSG